MLINMDNFLLLVFVIFAVFLVWSVIRIFRQRSWIIDLERRIIEINAELEKTNGEVGIIERGKTEFISIVSHQLRTPITAIKGHASMLLEDSYGKLPDFFRKPIEKIFLSSERLAQMVSDFLDLSKVEQGTMSYTFGPVDLKAVLLDLKDEFAAVAKKRGLKIDLEFSEEEFFIAWADEGKVRQILANLIDNSIKYTPKGKLHISLARDSAKGVVAVYVKDTGIGLSPEDVYHIFGKFTRGIEGKKESVDGSGLGLYIAKKMLEAQRGKIWVDSEGPGKGSTFVIELPLEKEA